MKGNRDFAWLLGISLEVLVMVPSTTKETEHVSDDASIAMQFAMSTHFPQKKRILPDKHTLTTTYPYSLSR